ncbi:MAG: PKD domain-containing protein, partial [Candidatus Micrarchaeota archaeon]|nr:PKD domain-containing protein [Candidatus Micrarchaeota archaeon]
PFSIYDPFVSYVNYQSSGLTASVSSWHLYDSNIGSSNATLSWNWGDGTSSKGWRSGLGHTYAANGTYTATLLMTDNLGNSYNYVQVLHISSNRTAEPMTMNISINRTALIVAPKGSVFDPNHGVNYLGLTWHWGDNTTTFGWPKNLTHTYPGPGNYILLATATDNLGYVGSYANLIVINQTSAQSQQLQTLYPGQSLYLYNITVTLAGLTLPDGNGNNQALLEVYNSGQLTNVLSISPDSTVKVDSGGVNFYIYVGQTFSGLNGQKWAQVQII